MGPFALRQFRNRYAFTPEETWSELAKRVPTAVFAPLVQRGFILRDLISTISERIAKRQFLPGGRYLANAGREYHQVNNCLLLRVEDSRESIGQHLSNHLMGLTTGAGIGTVYSALRPKGSEVKRVGGKAGGPLSYAIATNEIARPLRSGRDRQSALWAGLHWWHEDIFDWISAKNWPQWLWDQKARDWRVPAPLDGTNHSICYDDKFFEYIARGETHARNVFDANLLNTLRTGDPNFSIDVGPNAGEDLRNACTEVSSRDSDDICNIGSLNLAAFNSIQDFEAAVDESMAFLLAGSVYSDVPYPAVARIRDKNRRLGLGLMGVHEWLLKRGKKYGPDAELGRWLEVYATSTQKAAVWADKWGLSRPVKTRAMAPDGTKGIVAETVGSLEPLMAVAYRRRVFLGEQRTVEYVIDPVAKRLIESGINPDEIETAYSLSSTLEGVERRIAFQAWFQQYVDHGIASTVNLASWGSASNNEDTVQDYSRILLKYLHQLRGVTFYPDGARGGQPIVQVPYAEALKYQGQVVVEQTDVCNLRGGSCG